MGFDSETRLVLSRRLGHVCRPKATEDPSGRFSEVLWRPMIEELVLTSHFPPQFCGNRRDVKPFENSPLLFSGDLQLRMRIGKIGSMEVLDALLVSEKQTLVHV
jgi:hypothetical protein